MSRVDVVVVGGGNAGFCAAHAAAEQGARVVLLEKTSPEEAGGNSYYTAGAFRIAFNELAELGDLFNDTTTAERLARSVVPGYPAARFRADLDRVTQGRNDPVLTEVLISRSQDVLRWLAGKGMRWRLMYERQSYRSQDEWVFWGGLYVGTVDGGRGMVRQHRDAAQAAGVEVRYHAEVTRLDPVARTVGYRTGSGEQHLHADAIVLAAGGFEADPERRAHHMGEQWRHAFLRGSPANTGDVLDLALAAGAAAHGDWASCHSTAWDAGADPAGGERRLTNQLTRQSYPLGIVVNRDGRRFVDEGADFRNYTYAKYGREILDQPGFAAVQIFDAKTRPLLRAEEYDSEPITMARADSLADLARQLRVDPAGLVRTVEEFNAGVVDRPFDPAVKDGRRSDVEPPKSNWALQIDTRPYYGYPVVCGITFTFGGVHVDQRAAVLDASGTAIPGLYAAGELVGGLFSGNYPGGSGLTAGAVFGRLAGTHAAGGTLDP
ncbi:MAG: FAD-dependent tricarballylate dehydrogenase TcuA [Marmoricola sp.]